MNGSLDFEANSVGGYGVNGGNAQAIFDSQSTPGRGKAAIDSTGGNITQTNGSVTLKADGVSFVGPPEQQDWGGWLATMRDPSGNELQLVQYPAAT